MDWFKRKKSGNPHEISWGKPWYPLVNIQKIYGKSPMFNG